MEPAGIEETSQSQHPTSDDDAQLAALGHKAELKRNFSTL